MDADSITAKEATQRVILPADDADLERLEGFEPPTFC